jgi:hypothetical protein
VDKLLDDGAISVESATFLRENLAVLQVRSIP